MVGIVALAAAPRGAVTASAQQARPNFRSTTEIVRLRVAVFARDGGPVPVLDREDFTVLHDGQERDIEVFLGPDDGPIEVAMTVDMSRSMATWASRQALHQLLDGLHPDSCVLLLPFKQEVDAGYWGRPTDSALRSVIDETRQDGDGEAVYDALIAAFSSLRERAGESASPSPLRLGQLVGFRAPGVAIRPVPPPAGTCAVPRATDGGGALEPRKAVVIVTDQPDSASKATLDDVLLASWGSGIPVFTLAITSRDDPENLASRHALIRKRLRQREAERYEGPLEALAAYSGGFVLRGSKGRYDERSERWLPDLVGDEPTALEGMERLGQALGGHYVLGFSPERELADDVPMLRESSVEVRLGRDDLELITSRQLATGQARSAGAALDTALAGFRALASGKLEMGLEAFELALSIDSGVGLFHYGRALSLVALRRHRDSLDAFQEAERRAPWLPELSVRIAHAALEAGEVDLAWEHAVRAFYRGSDVAELLAALQELDPRPVDLSKPPEDPLVGLVIERGGGGLVTSLASPTVVAVLMSLMQTSNVMQLSLGEADSTDLMLTIRFTEAEVNGPWISARGRVALVDREGKEWATESFRVHDAGKLEEVTEELVPVFERLETAFRNIERGSGS